MQPNPNRSAPTAPTIPPTLTLAAAARQSWPVVVVGAGPAGAMAAREVARAGVRVLLVDKAAFPRTKVCGCCLNRMGLDVLAQAGLGDLAETLGGVALTELRLAVGRRQARLPLPGMVALSRDALDAALVRAAIAAGADFLPEAQATLAPATPDQPDRRLLILRPTGTLAAAGTARIAASLVLAADGLASRLRAEEPGGRPWVRRGSRLGAGAVAEAGPDFYAAGTITMACARGGYVGLVRLEDGRLNLAAALDPERVKALGGLGPAVAAIMKETGATAGLPAIEGLESLPWRGTPPLTRGWICPAAYRLLALGDAAGYVEPFTGEGMAWALAQGMTIAPLAVRAAHEWRPEIEAEWTRLYRRHIASRQHVCRAVAAVLRHPALLAVLTRILALQPGLARPLVARLNAPILLTPNELTRKATSP